MKRIFYRLIRSCRPASCVSVLAWFILPLVLTAAEQGKTFSTPQELVNALGQIINTTNRAAFGELFGSDSSWISNPDPVLGANELAEFTVAFNKTNHLVRQSDSRMILEVGPNSWPFPIPIVKTSGGWCYDTAAGREEILNRRIGRNEIEALQAIRAYVEAQREYASRDRDGDDVLEYAQKLRSSPGKTDGLYWPPEVNGEASPLGPFYAEAQNEGYFQRDAGTPQPFHGYFFKILTRQGSHAPGGKYNYLINGNLIGGFALVAWPAEYRESGVMTFIVNQQGRVYQKDLGPKTGALASKMKEYDLDPAWRLSPD